MTLTDDALGAPSVREIESVMQRTVETNDATEHFQLTGTPVSITSSNGDTFTAALGTRSPTADGYGQIVFFFHNHRFVGLDSSSEKVAVQSIKPAQSGMQFDVTYANYAPSDPMYAPSLAPVTVSYAWNGSSVTMEGNTSIPSGALNGFSVQTTQSPVNTSAPADAVQAIQSGLPKLAKLVNLPGESTPYLSVDLNADGQPELASAYQTTDGNIGLIVVGLVNGTWKTLWQKTTDGTQLREFNSGAMTGDGTEEIAFQTYIGDGANNVIVLKWTKGQVTPVLNVSGSADIGDFNGNGQMEVANWVHDTGPLENIQLYAWNQTDNRFMAVPNSLYPAYFAGAIPVRQSNLHCKCHIL